MRKQTVQKIARVAQVACFVVVTLTIKPIITQKCAIAGVACSEIGLKIDLVDNYDNETVNSD